MPRARVANVDVPAERGSARAREAVRTLEALGHGERLEFLSRRWELPFCPEYDLAFFTRAHFEVLREALRGLEGAPGPDARAWRGRARRLLGDVVGAREDLAAAARDGSGRAALWLAEIDLDRPAAEGLLGEAAARLPGEPSVALYLGASRLLRGRPDAAAPLRRFVRRRPGSCLGHMLLGVALQREGRRAQAVAGFRRAAAADPTCAAPHLLRARALEDGAAMVRACEDAFEVDPEYAHIAMCRSRGGARWPQTLRGLVRFAFGERRILSPSARYLEQDRRILPEHFLGARWSEELLRRHPKRSWSWGLVGRAYARCPPASGLPQKSLAIFDRAVRLATRQGWALGWRGVARLGVGRRSEALADLDECLRRAPYYFWAYEWRGGLLQSLGRDRRALADLDRAVAMNPHYPFSLNRRSQARRAVGDFAGAALDLDEAFRLDPRYAWVMPTGRAPRTGELDDGIAELARAERAYPSLPSLPTWRGQLQLQKRDLSAAFGAFERALALDPSHHAGRAWYGRALIEAGRLAEARRLLSRCVETAGDRWVYRLWLAEALRLAGDARGALTELDAILRVQPRCAPAWQGRSRAALAAGRGSEALRCARRAIVLDGRSADNHFAAAEALSALGSLKAAEAALGRVLAVSSHHGRAWLLRAETRVRLGRSAEAIADYRRVLADFPFLFNAEQRRRVESLLEAA